MCRIYSNKNIYESFDSSKLISLYYLRNTYNSHTDMCGHINVKQLTHFSQANTKENI